MNDTDHPAANGQAPAPADIPFGDLPNQRFSPLWAEGVLRELFEHHPQTFASCLTAYTTGIRGQRRGRPAGTEAAR